MLRRAPYGAIFLLIAIVRSAPLNAPEEAVVPASPPDEKSQEILMEKGALGVGPKQLPPADVMARHLVQTGDLAGFDDVIKQFRHHDLISDEKLLAYQDLVHLEYSILTRRHNRQIASQANERNVRELIGRIEFDEKLRDDETFDRVLEEVVELSGSTGELLERKELTELIDFVTSLSRQERAYLEVAMRKLLELARDRLPVRLVGDGDGLPVRLVGAGDGLPVRLVGAGDGLPDRQVGAGDGLPVRQVGAGANPERNEVDESDQIADELMELRNELKERNEQQENREEKNDARKESEKEMKEKMSGEQAQEIRKEKENIKDQNNMKEEKEAENEGKMEKGEKHDDENEKPGEKVEEQVYKKLNDKLHEKLNDKLHVKLNDKLNGEAASGEKLKLALMRKLADHHLRSLRPSQTASHSEAAR